MPRRARAEALALNTEAMVFEAPHFTTWLYSRLDRGCPPEIRTTLDLSLAE